MNIEIYSIVKSKSDKSVEEDYPDLNAELSNKGINTICTTKVENNELGLIKAISYSEKSEHNIDAIIILDEYTCDKPSTVYNTLCQLCSCDYTPAKKILDGLEEDQKIEDNITTPIPITNGISYTNAFYLDTSNNQCKSLCFFHNNLKIITLSSKSIDKTNIAQIIAETAEKASLKGPTPYNDIKELGLEFEITPPANNKKRGFIKRFIPTKGDRPSDIVLKIILILSSITCIVTAGILFNVMVIRPMLNDNMMNQIRDTATIDTHEKTTENNKKDVKEKTRPNKNWSELHKVNHEIVAWLQIPETVIDYPVLEHKGDNAQGQYYIYRDIHGNYSAYGSLFMDYRCEDGINSKNVIIHGHHMNDGRMFQNLMNYGRYSGNLEFYKKHPIVYFDTPKEKADWKIISIYKTNTLDEHGEYFDYTRGSFKSDAEFMNYVYLIRERSLIDCPVDVNEKDCLISLSTCSYEFSDFRTVLVARKCRRGENNKVDVKKAKINTDALWPDVFYSSYGGTKPNISSFSKAYKAGKVDWYDGKGNIKGVENDFTENTTKK